MRILITGICGFVGNAIALRLVKRLPGIQIVGLDNFIRPGSEMNREQLKKLGCRLFHGDIRNASDLEAISEVDWVIDAAANPSVLAGIDGQTSSRQLIEHNLVGTINLMEYCKRSQCGFILLSTSRVYSIPGLSALAMDVRSGAFVPDRDQEFPRGISMNGVSEDYSTEAPVSLYGSSKVASEALALEYGETFGIPVWVNRCGVLAGSGQFGRPDQGIFSYWIHSWRARRPLKYIGFAGTGHQVRDCLHPDDLVELLLKQIEAGRGSGQPRKLNVSGGAANSISLKQLSEWCRQRFGDHEVNVEPIERPFDIPWMVLDSARASIAWDWFPRCKLDTVLSGIADHAEQNPDWLGLSAPL
jgi:CDP-paratose 2-epimerase